MTKQEYEDKIADLEKKVKDLEESRLNSLESCRLSLKKNKAAREEAEKGARDIRKMCNSILMMVAHKYKGRIAIPKNHMEMTKDWRFETTEQGDYYIFRVKEDDNVS